MIYFNFMIKKLYNIVVCVSVCLFVIGCNEPTQIISNYSASQQDKVAIQNYIKDENFSDALRVADSLLQFYPNDPQLPTLKGFAYYIIGDSSKYKESFNLSIDIYDFLLSERPSFSDEINKAACILFVNGNGPFQEFLDKLEQNKEYTDYERNLIYLWRNITTDELVLQFFSEDKRYNIRMSKTTT